MDTKNSNRVVPLFRLGINVLPQELLPLHIFELRYQRMLQHCLENDAPMAILLSVQNKTFEHGCLVKVCSLLQTYEDGRSDIIVEGTERFRLLHILPEEDHFAFPRAHIEIFDDEQQEETIDTKLRAEVLQAALQWCESLGRADELPEARDITALLAAAVVPLDLFERQELLRQRSENERLRLVKTYLAFRQETFNRAGLQALEEMHSV